MSKNKSINLFLQGGRNVSVPFTLSQDDILYNCTKVLRLLPAKRLVLEAQSSKHHLVIKLFSPNHKGRRELAREQQGHQQAKAAGINVPNIILSSNDMADCFAIGYQFIENSQSFNLDNESKSIERVANLLELMAKMHKYGIVQNDIHMDNVLLVDETLYLIDLGSIVCEQEGVALSQKKSIDNVALLIAQFVPQIQAQLIEQLPIYYQARGWDFDRQQQADFMQALDKAWQKRKRDYLSKCFRTCTMTQYDHGISREYAFRTDFISELSIDLINNVDSLMDNGKVLKAGNSATVVRVELDGRDLVIKRYNIKGIWHFLRRCFRPSRAAISWRNANLLEFIGIETPKPLGFIENKIGWLRHTAYFISEFTEAEELLNVYQRQKPTEHELNQIANIFDLLQKSQICHGDLKASNLLLDVTGKIWMIDLDSMQEYSNRNLFINAFAKDKDRFLRNWQDPKIKELFGNIL
ncbi:MAG: hypothetical protein HRT92_00860 [Piscirickettsiaceae bacterium]|nr:hypothetical protein [Piscirickettsiaceae bacterium]